MMLLVTYILLCATKIGVFGNEEGSHFRFDYTYSENASGWFKFHRVPDKWNGARERCQNEGAVLASPLTKERQEAILNHVSKESVDTIFTGVHATFSQGDYSSVEGTLLEMIPITWAQGEPDNKGNSESCLAMKTRDGTMADVKCDDGVPYVCYKKWTNIALTECGTHDIDYKLDARTGSCYKFHPRGLTWSKAYMTCAAEGAYLAIMNSKTESLVLKELYAQYSNTKIFAKNMGAAHVGLRNLKDGGSWMTIHGQTMTESGFDQWSGGQPDNSTKYYSGGEACGSIFKSGEYNDAWCDLELAFICEKAPRSLLNINVSLD